MSSLPGFPKTMNRRELPVLGLPFRKYPTKLDRQSYDDERRVCSDCLSGACCESEDPIFLSGFDVFRLAAFFNVSPAEFLLRFTQDSFGDDARGEMRRKLIDDPNCSIVTYLRRRDNFPASPCIFLKYVREEDGTPRRLCSVYDARPLACREFYFDLCKKRVTGELAAVLAEGYERVRDGEITEDRVIAEIEAFNHTADRLDTTLAHWFWLEMRRVLNWEQANTEGSNSYDMAELQDPIDEKLNRILSAKDVRFEEECGHRVRRLPQASFNSGLGFSNSPDRARIDSLVRNEPSSRLYASSREEVTVGLRTLCPGAKHAEAFATIPAGEIEDFIATIPEGLLSPDRELVQASALSLRKVYRAVLGGFNHLIRLVSYLCEMGNVLEDSVPGEFESEMLTMLAGFEPSLNPFIARNPYFEPVKSFLARATIEALERKVIEALSPRDSLKVLCLLQGTQAAVVTLDRTVAERFDRVAQAVASRLGSRFEGIDNAAESRRTLRESLRSRTASKALCEETLFLRCAAQAGFTDADPDSFNDRLVHCLEGLPFRKSYVGQLCDLVVSLGISMGSRNTIALNGEGLARRLSEYATQLLSWIEREHPGDVTREGICKLAAAAYKTLGKGYDHDFVLILSRIVEAQLSDGSWDTNPLPEEMPDCQLDYFRLMHRPTWACIDVLRPLRTDASNPANAGLGLA